MPEREIHPANGHELHIIEYLMALDAQLNGHQDALRERLKLVPNGWRQWRLITTATRSLLQAVYDTLPDKTLLYIDRLRAQGEVVVRFRPASYFCHIDAASSPVRTTCGRSSTRPWLASAPSACGMKTPPSAASCGGP